MVDVVVAIHRPKNNHRHSGHHQMAVAYVVHPVHKSKGYHLVLAEGLLLVPGTQSKVPSGSLPHHVYRGGTGRVVPEQVHLLVKGYSCRVTLHGCVRVGPLDHGPEVKSHRHLVGWKWAARNNQGGTSIHEMGPRAHISACRRAGHMCHCKLVQTNIQTNLDRVRGIKELHVPSGGACLIVAGAKSGCRRQRILR